MSLEVKVILQLILIYVAIFFGHWQGMRYERKYPKIHKKD